MRYFILLFLFLPFLQAQESKLQEIPLSELKPLRPAPEAQFAFLCLNDGKVATADALKASLVKWFKLKSADEIRKFTYKPATHSFSWGIGRSRFVATLELAPIPKGDISYASNNSLHWPNALKEMLEHKAHYTITCTSIHREAWHAALDLTHALAALTETHNTTGIYWGDAAIVHSPESFLHQSKFHVGSDAKIPSSLWVGLLFESTKAGEWNIFTDGFGPLGYQDIEIHKSNLSRAKLFSFLDQVKQDVLTKKVLLKDDLILDDADGNRWKVSTGKSIIGKDQPIWLLTQQ